MASGSAYQQLRLLHSEAVDDFEALALHVHRELGTLLLQHRIIPAARDSSAEEGREKEKGEERKEGKSRAERKGAEIRVVPLDLVS